MITILPLPKTRARCNRMEQKRGLSSPKPYPTFTLRPGAFSAPQRIGELLRARMPALRKECCAAAARCRSGSLAHLLAPLLLILSFFSAHAEQEFHAALDSQRKALTDAVARRDAPRVARIFTSDAKLMAPGFETVTGREAIQQFWQAGLNSGILNGITLTPADLTGEADGLLAETGTVAMLDADGKEKDRSRYLIVWKREQSDWRIHRDIVNAELPAGPKVDRVGFPKEYRTIFKVLGL